MGTAIHLMIPTMQLIILIVIFYGVLMYVLQNNMTIIRVLLVQILNGLSNFLMQKLLYTQERSIKLLNLLEADIVLPEYLLCEVETILRLSMN